MAAALAPAAARGEPLGSVPLGTRIRADVHTADVSRLRRVLAQPVTGDLVGVQRVTREAHGGRPAARTLGTSRHARPFDRGTSHARPSHPP
jgi:hypothetical protein